MSCFFIFILRAVGDDDDAYHPFLTPTQIDAAKALDSALNQPDIQLLNPIHSLAYALMSNCLPEVEKNQFKCPQITFLIFSNVRPDSTFETPETISKCLSKLSWGIRATAVYEALAQQDEYEYPDGSVRSDGMLGYVLTTHLMSVMVLVLIG